MWALALSRMSFSSADLVSAANTSTLTSFPLTWRSHAQHTLMLLASLMHEPEFTSAQDRKSQLSIPKHPDQVLEVSKSPYFNKTMKLAGWVAHRWSGSGV